MENIDSKLQIKALRHLKRKEKNDTINRSKNKQGFLSKIELLREINQNSLEIDFKLVARNDHNR